MFSATLSSATQALRSGSSGRLRTASRRFSREIRAASREKRRKEGDVASVVQETLSSLTVIQAFAQEDAEREQFGQEEDPHGDIALQCRRKRQSDSG